jgi:predicted transcriptional regulator
MAEKEKMENLYRTPLPGGAPRSIYEVAKVLGRSQEKVSVQLKEQGVQIRTGGQQPSKAPEVGVAHMI